MRYVGVVELLWNLPLYGGRFDSPLIRDLESRRDVLTGQSTGYGPSGSADSRGVISETSGSGIIQGVHCLSKRKGTDASVEGRQNVLVHGVAAVVVEATSLQVNMVHGKGDDAESGGSRGRCQAAARQDETNETSIDVPSADVACSDGAVVGSVTSVVGPSEGVECSDGSVVGSVTVVVPSADVECSDGAVVGFVTSVDAPSTDVECSDGAVVGSVTSVVGPSEGVGCSDGAVVGSVTVVVPSADLECNDGAAVGFVTSVDAPSTDVECSNGAVVGSVTSVVGPSEIVVFSDGAAVLSVPSVVGQRKCRVWRWSSGRLRDLGERAVRRCRV